ncbi:hypothetical protein [Fluviicola sp.]|uniref:hypothetical protein n=1 Tax=Fluviicola sp. TaxID=1917219 RepID=UPI0031D65231
MINRNKQLLFGITLIALFNTACGESKTSRSKDSGEKDNSRVQVEKTSEKEVPVIALKKDPLDYIPKGMVLFDKVSGDLNKDGIPDLVLMIKGTDKNNFVQDEYRGELDRNRRGILVLFKHKDGYELVSKNADCFSSENEDGGVYYPPELSLDIRKGNLYVEYRHGRYGYWTYTFRYQNGELELIGYDSTSAHGPVIEHITSINFVTKRKQDKVNTNELAEPEEEVYKETWKDIKQDKRMKLSEIKDFDELYFPEYD